METTRQKLISETKTPSQYALYQMVVIEKDIITPSGQVFAKGEVTLADSELYEMRGDTYRAVYSAKTQAHVMMPSRQVADLREP